MRRLMITGILTAALVAAAAVGAAATARTAARTPAGQTLPITIDVLVRTTVFPAESCCHWVARHSHDGFRGGTVDRCATGDRLLPDRYGVISRLFIYRSIPPDRVYLD